MIVNLTPAKFKKKPGNLNKDLSEEDIPRLLTLRLTKRMLLGLANSQYDPMGLICPILIILKIHLRDLFGPEADLDWEEKKPPDKTERLIGIIYMSLRMGDFVLTRAISLH